MKETDPLEKNLIRAYVIITIALLVLIKTVQIMHAGRTINLCMYLAIAVNTAVTACFHIRRGRYLKDRHANLIAYGLYATFVADFFATMLGKRVSPTAYLCGIACFCAVELIYAAYLRAGKGAFIMRAAMIAASLMILRSKVTLSTGTVLGAVDEMLILANVIDAWAARRISPPLLFKAGITMFLACDTSIVIRTLASGTIHDAAAFMVWIFYVPAQLLITLSYVSCCRTERSY